MIHFISQWLWAIFLLLLLLREVFIGYKYGTQEPLKVKKGLQRQLPYLIVICFASWIIFELTVPKETIFKELNKEMVEEVKDFNQNLSGKTLELYKEKFMTHEWEVPINLEGKVTILNKYDGLIRFNEGMYIQENENLTNTLKISVLQTSLIDIDYKIIYEINRKVEVEIREENDIKISIDPKIKLPEVTIVNENLFKDHPWIFEMGINYSEALPMYFYIIVEVPVGTQFRDLMDTKIVYLKDRYIY